MGGWGGGWGGVIKVEVGERKRLSSLWRVCAFSGLKCQASPNRGLLIPLLNFQWSDPGLETD